MENFKDLVQKRRSIRKFTDEEIKAEDLQTILRAALMSPTSKGTRAWHFVVVDDKSLLEKISLCRLMGSQFIAGAKVAIVVLGDREVTDAWCEDASSLLSPCSIRLPIWDLVPAGVRCVTALWRMASLPTTCSVSCSDTPRT